MINVVGSVYYEKCFEPFVEEIYGSGLRACTAINGIDVKVDVKLFTFGDLEINTYLEQVKSFNENFSYYIEPINNSLCFYYDYPLSEPRINPRLDTLKIPQKSLSINGGNVLQYGFVEGLARVDGNKVVYDPQSPINPKSFKASGSIAKELAIVANFSEAKHLAGSENLNEIKHYFFYKEQADILVLKLGAKGALVCLSESDKENVVPVYKTDNVYSIGSGDVFSALFAYHWFNGAAPLESAKLASFATAEYCNSGQYSFSRCIDRTRFSPLIIKKDFPKKIYLAGPFFTMSERWLVQQIKMSLEDFGLEVFSPWHDVGYGPSTDVVSKDLEAIINCNLVFALVDGLDSGTMFEIGYASSLNKPIICFVQNERLEDLTMLTGSNCLLVNDITTAIYKAYWKLAENE
ncbi:PfkB family carbohydrate kinase [Olivibacter domesticus]|uniref:Nucleoside 2-deoxyribosyltransferase n=1 Tax=Olivibacter domesticus TaxID=407022 RepID=A0A1H7GR56_OLID1|nr:PfkB family carbohydrate kinase [Olivibacter domesticus]SEK39482.1 Nucleoside 2-deoxyribosyltransferase [Olivibacter domesticus]